MVVVTGSSGEWCDTQSKGRGNTPHVTRLVSAGRKTFTTLRIRGVPDRYTQIADIDMYGAQLTGRGGKKGKHPEILSIIWWSNMRQTARLCVQRPKMDRGLFYTRHRALDGLDRLSSYQRSFGTTAVADVLYCIRYMAKRIVRHCTQNVDLDPDTYCGSHVYVSFPLSCQVQ